MRAARLVVLSVALAAGGATALLVAGIADKKPGPPPPPAGEPIRDGKLIKANGSGSYTTSK